MNDEELKQRIQYMIEHGGMWSDPIEEVRHAVIRTRLCSAGLALLIIAADVATDYLL